MFHGVLRDHLHAHVVGDRFGYWGKVLSEGCHSEVAHHIKRGKPGNVPSVPGFRLRGGVWIAGAAMVLCLWLLSNASLKEARDTAIAAAIGYVIYGAYRSYTVRL
jgi:hypothetical protein